MALRKITRTGSGSIWNWEEDGTLRGYYIGKEEGVGKHQNSTLYHIVEKITNNDYKVWGSKILDDYMSQVDLGEYVEITRLGKVEGQKYNYWNFEVFADDEDTMEPDEKQYGEGEPVPADEAMGEIDSEAIFNE